MATFRKYVPEQTPRTKRIAPRAWDERRSQILDLYLEQDLSVEEVALAMASRHGFEATLACNSFSPTDVELMFSSVRQYRFNFAKWKVAKNIPGNIIRCAARKLHEKPERHGFEYKQRAISLSAIDRFQTRYPEFDPASSPTDSTSSEMTWSTASDASTTPRATTPNAFGADEEISRSFDAVSPLAISRFQAGDSVFDAAFSPTASISSEIDWVIASDASLTPRAGTPDALMADKKASESIDLDQVTISMMNLSHGQVQGSTQYPDGPSRAKTPLHEDDEQTSHESHPLGSNSDDHFKNLERHRGYLLADLLYGKTPEDSYIETYKGWLSAFEPSGRYEEELIEGFLEIFAKPKAEGWTSGRYRRAQYWRCCTCCNHGGIIEINVGCAMCDHHRCRNCRPDPF